MSASDSRSRSMFWRTASAVPRYHSASRCARDEGLRGSACRRSCGRGPRAACADVVVERVRVVLRQDDHVVDVGVDAVAQREVDDPVLARKGDGGLGTHAREDREALTLASGQHDREQALHVSILGQRDGPTVTTITRSCKQSVKFACWSDRTRTRSNVVGSAAARDPTGSSEDSPERCSRTRTSACAGRCCGRYRRDSRSPGPASRAGPAGRHSSVAGGRTTSRPHARGR